VGRFDDSIAEAKRAQELDPLSVAISGSVADAYYFARKYDQAIQAYKATLKMDPNFIAAHIGLALSYEQKKMYPEAVVEWQAMAQLYRVPAGASLLGEAYKSSGYPAVLQTLLDGSLKGQSVDPAQVASVYARMGKKNEALTWLEKTYAERSGRIVRLRSDPKFDSLRSEPGFVSIIRRMNFPD
jgi:tetratricopeptide (TPR) repeat protein